MTFLKAKTVKNERTKDLVEEMKQRSKFVKFSMNIPRSLHEKFRRKSFLDDKDMKDVLMEAIDKYMRT